MHLHEQLYSFTGCTILSLEPLNNAFSLFSCPALCPDKNKVSSMHSTISEKKLSRKIAVIALML
tara:strand:- start:233 stop:424 length:192 start_codon:yes stop_codon:yes gene_type:complete